MVFYIVHAKKAKEVYNRRRINEYMGLDGPGLISYYKLLMNIRNLFDMKDICVSYRFLRSHGVKINHVRYLISEGILEEIDIPINEAIRISLINKHKTDPVFAAKTAAQSRKNIEKAREAQRKAPDYMERARKIIKKARRSRDVPIRRRKRNLKKVLIEKFGELPERISIRGVEEILEGYPKVLWDYPDDDRLYMRLFSDLNSLGIDTNCRSETMIKEMEKRLSNPEYREFLLKRAEEMTEVKKKLYEEQPELKEEADRKSVETRKKKMQEDKEFRKMTMDNLAKGNSVFVEKYRTDEKFRKKMLKVHLRGLRKGTRTVIRRAKRRRNALNKWIIKPYFSDPFGAKPKEIERLFNTEHTDFRDEYYRNMSLYRAIKRDLQRLREEFPYSVPSDS